jgi:hypothetical protein
MALSFDSNYCLNMARESTLTAECQRGDGTQAEEHRFPLSSLKQTLASLKEKLYLVSSEETIIIRYYQFYSKPQFSLTCYHGG